MASWITGVATAVTGIFTANSQAKARAAEANSRAEIAKAKAQEHAAEQARLKAQYEADSKERIKQLEAAQAKQEAESQAAREKEEQAHKERLQEMERVREQENKELKLKQKNIAINECKEEISKCKENIESATQNLGNVTDKLGDAHEKISILNERIENFATDKQKKLSNLAEEIGLEKARLDLARVDNELTAAIELTSVHEDNVPKFLALIVNLTDATMSNQENANYLSAELETFGELIQRAGTSKLTVEQYFSESNMQRFIPILEAEDMTNMNDLICKGDDKEDEFEETMKYVQEGMQQQHDQWEEEKTQFESDPDNVAKKLVFSTPEPKTKLSLKHRRFFTKVCLKPDTWQAAQEAKIKLVTKKLDDISGPLASFFDKIHVCMKQVQRILAFGNGFDALTDEQQRAINFARGRKPRAIAPSRANGCNGRIGRSNGCNGPKNTPMQPDPSETDFESKDAETDAMDQMDEEDINEAREQFDAAVTTDVVSESGRNLGLTNVFDQQRKRRFEESAELSKAAILSIDVVDQMRDEFEKSPHTQGALVLAKGIERTCMDMVRNIGQIRQSLLLAHCIIEMKPANLNPTSRKLWTAVDSGVVQIYKNALEMSRVSATFFGFFAKLQQSFGYYLTCAAEENNNLMLSTEHLQRDVREFKKMSGAFGKQVSVLGDSAIKCIEDCVRHTAGANNFEKNRSDREKKLSTYLEKKNIYDRREVTFDAEYDRILGERGELKAQATSLEFVAESLREQIKHNETIRSKFQGTVEQLNKIIV